MFSVVLHHSETMGGMYQIIWWYQSLIGGGKVFWPSCCVLVMLLFVWPECSPWFSEGAI